MRRIVGYGDFNCPWSYLASRRLGFLAAHGVDVDWRAVEHEPWQPRPFMDSSVRFGRLREEMEQVVATLLPREDLPYSLAGFVPYTAAAVSGYAEAYGVGRADPARGLLFEALWVHGVDLGDARLVRTLLVDAIRSGSVAGGPLHEWGYGVDVTGGPVTSSAWRRIRSWLAEWRESCDSVVPVLVADDGDPIVGAEAVTWLGAEVAELEGETGALPAPSREPQRNSDLASLSWVSANGNRWMRDYQQAHGAPLFPRVG